MPVLVRCGGSVSAEDDEGRTPAYLALLYACTPAAAALLAFPQSLEHTTKVGRCSVYYLVYDIERTLVVRLYFCMLGSHVVFLLSFSMGLTPSTIHPHFS